MIVFQLKYFLNNKTLPVMLQLNMEIKAAEAALLISTDFWSAVHVSILASAMGVSEDARRSALSITSTRHLR